MSRQCLFTQYEMEGVVRVWLQTRLQTKTHLSTHLRWVGDFDRLQPLTHVHWFADSCSPDMVRVMMPVFVAKYQPTPLRTTPSSPGTE